MCDAILCRDWPEFPDHYPHVHRSKGHRGNQHWEGGRIPFGDPRPPEYILVAQGKSSDIILLQNNYGD